jgi:hypothetical protein
MTVATLLEMSAAGHAERVFIGSRSGGLTERVRPDVALRGYLSPLDDPGGAPRRIRIGLEADLCLLRVPRAEAMSGPYRDTVRMTICAGRIVASD